MSTNYSFSVPHSHGPDELMLAIRLVRQYLSQDVFHLDDMAFTFFILTAQAHWLRSMFFFICYKFQILSTSANLCAPDVRMLMTFFFGSLEILNLIDQTCTPHVKC